MILRRLGNKSAIAHKIIPYFPEHKIYIEPFFGAGGMFFNKPKAKYNILNDLDSDVFNLFQVVMNKKNELEKAFYMMPIHSDLLNYWKVNKETDPIKKALRFLFLSNFTYLGKQDCLSLVCGNAKKILYERLEETHKLIFDIQFANFDYIKFLKSLSFRNELDLNSSFIYSDPPYISTVDTYGDSDTWNESDSEILFNELNQTGCKWAMSEFDNPFILKQANERGLSVHIIGERRSLKNRRTEILVTNYKKKPTLFD
jgi:DNA adenine methylase